VVTNAVRRTDAVDMEATMVADDDSAASLRLVGQELHSNLQGTDCGQKSTLTLAFSDHRPTIRSTIIVERIGQPTMSFSVGFDYRVHWLLTASKPSYRSGTTMCRPG
jgi:hypothetical protein